ncbi:hypothetical protein EDD66_10885 [Mobilisporobacter senegalensis]|uniref:Uncharacterized protein n=1 Tax=Mobilisporobacter senegalensis TaxID=1329262 RepID=A0A3N1XI28_9FIRM|nr:hypothetical protein [Mobilisporobacter senegalensis]ROR26363.1 hypothetical protein EDD66_10885 [Mobilisporobacter senegalensis]
MNHEFVTKMIQAKKMEYEALKEIMPEKMADHINELENNIIDVLKECILSGFTDTRAQKDSEETKTKVQKVEID